MNFDGLCIHSYSFFLSLHGPRLSTPASAGPVSSLSTEWHDAQLFWKITAPSCAQSLFPVVNSSIRKSWKRVLTPGRWSFISVESDSIMWKNLRQLAAKISLDFNIISTCRKKFWRSIQLAFNGFNNTVRTYDLRLSYDCQTIFIGYFH